MYLKKIIHLLLQLFLLMFIFFNASVAVTADLEQEYFTLKGDGHYREAIRTLKKWTLAEKDPAMAEANIFRINELVLFPELIDDAIEAFQELKQGSLILKERDLQSRIDAMLSNLLLRKGRLNESEDLIKKTGFLDFDILGPFPGNSVEEYEKNHVSGDDLDRKKIYNGKNFEAYWIKGTLDRRGTHDLRGLFSDTGNSFFYFYREIQIPRDGEYRFIIGKTGFTDIVLDGTPVFSSRDKHDFHHDQYFLKLWIPSGTHKVLVKSGDYNGMLQFAFRVTDMHGVPVTGEKGGYVKPASPARFLGASLFPSLERLSSVRDLSEEQSFLAGYLTGISNLSSDDNSTMIKYFSKVGIKSRLHSAALTYSGKSEKTMEKKEEYFRDAMSSGRGNLDPLIEVINHKLAGGFYYDAFPLIEKIKEINRDSVLYPWYMAKLLQGKGWNSEAVKYGDKLLSSEYPSLGHIVLSASHLGEKRYKQAIKNLQYLADADMYNREVSRNLSECYMKTGNISEALHIQESLAFIFRGDVDLRLELSKSVEFNRGLAEALPYVSSALKLSPYNSRSLFRLGDLYNKMGKIELAQYYFRTASYYDPDNYQIKRYLVLTGNGKNETAEYLYNGDASDLARKAGGYRDEPAVILLSETGIRVNTDGSYEKWRRKIIKINDESAVKNFSTQYVILDPAYDTVENLNCTVINDGSRTGNTGSYRKSLSDPESRLYYNLEALTVPVNALRKGSILDISYTIKNRSGREYKNYFGEKIVIGDEYRTILTNIILSHQAGRKIFLHKKGMEGMGVETVKKPNLIIHRITADNRAPYKKEKSMPYYTEVLPAVFFTSHKSWDEVYSWYRSLLRNRIKAGPEIKRSLAKIISPSDSGIEKARKIYRHVTDTIRYVGFEFGIGGIQPRDSDLTYASRMGDCKDITLVLVAMLREAGLDSRLALVRTRDKGKAFLPAPYIGEFNHAICYLKIDGGSRGPVEFFMDGTAEDTGFREIPEEIYDVTAFVLDDRGFRFMKTGGVFYIPGVQKVSTRVMLDRDGKARLERSLVISGNSAPDARGELKNGDKKMIMLNEYWGKIYPGAVVSGLTVQSLSTDNPVSYSYIIEIPSFARPAEDDLIFRSFLIPSDFYKAYGISRTRTYPVILSSRTAIQVSVEYFFPKGYRLHQLPENAVYENEKFRSSFSYSKGGNSLKAVSIIEIRNSEIQPEEYEKFREFSRHINRKELERIVLVKE